MLPGKSLIIAVDFDGTIVEDGYPKIGKPKLFAFETLKKLQQEGHRLILWTYRSGVRLEEAIDFCEENGINFYAVNRSFPEEEYSPSMSRKINADIFHFFTNLFLSCLYKYTAFYCIKNKNTDK